MLFKYVRQVLLAVLCFFFADAIFASPHPLSLGFAVPMHESEHNYRNSGAMLSGTLHQFKPLDDMLVFSVDTSLGFWHASSKQHSFVMNVSLYGNFKAYFRPIDPARFSPYLLLGFGPSILSSEQLGDNKQGSHFDFQTQFGVGAAIPLKNRHQLLLDVRFLHLCNAGLAKPNQGFNFPLILSVGYVF